MVVPRRVAYERLVEVTDETPETNYAFVHRDAHAGLLAALEALA